MMPLTTDQIIADRARMEKFICERIPDDGTWVDLGNGAWADLTPFWDERFGWSLLLETNEPEWVDLWEVYQHFRRKEMTSREWWEEMNREIKPTQENGVAHHLPVEQEDQGRMLLRLSEIEQKLEAASKVTLARLLKIEVILTTLVQQHTIKEFYTTDDICKMFGKAPYTVREWCRLRRINAKKVPSPRGGEFEWRISHEELVRIQNEGLLPIPTKY